VAGLEMAHLVASVVNAMELVMLHVQDVAGLEQLTLNYPTQSKP